MTALVFALAIVVLQVAYGWPAAALGTLACAATFIATATTAQKEQQIMAETASDTDQGVLRRRAARLAQLGVLRSCEPDHPERPTTYTIVTAGGDVVDVERQAMPAYLSGLAHGAHAVRAAE